MRDAHTGYYRYQRVICRQANFGEPDFAVQLADVIACWTLTGDDGRMLPISEDTVGQLLPRDVDRILASYGRED